MDIPSYSSDAQSQHGIDVEAEIMAALAQEITAEIDQEILRSLRTLAGTASETYNPSSSIRYSYIRR